MHFKLLILQETKIILKKEKTDLMKRLTNLWQIPSATRLGK
jgi:hypothetical protein